MRDTVHGLVRGLGSEIVEHQNRCSAAGKIVLESKDLAAVAQ